MENIKVQRTYNLDLEIVKLLDNEKNKSEIVNNLLKEYFKGVLNKDE